MTTFKQPPAIHVVPWLFWADAWVPVPQHIFISSRINSFDQRHQLIAHELVHVAQMQSHGLARWWARYAFSRKWRLAYELEAYVTSVECGASLAGCATFLSTWWRYWLFLSVEDIGEALFEAWASRHEWRAKGLCMAEAIYSQQNS